MRAVWLSALVLLLNATSAFAQLSSQLIVSGLSLPVAVVQDPTQPNVQLVVEQGGRIRVVRNGALEAADFLDPHDARDERRRTRVARPRLRA